MAAATAVAVAEEIDQLLRQFAANRHGAIRRFLRLQFGSWRKLRLFRVIDKVLAHSKRGSAHTMAEPLDTYALARVDLVAAGTHGWQVRMQRRGVKYGKFFADRGYGGAQASYEAARLWRNALLEKLIAEESQARICRRSPRNSSGVVGVSKVSVNAANGETYHFWQATWCPAPGERRCVKFSIKRFGDKKAFTLAVEARREGVGE